MRHTKVAKAPAQAGDDLGAFGHGVPVIGRDSGHSLRIDERNSKNRRNQQRAQNHQALVKICPADSRKAAQEGVADDDEGCQVHGVGLVDADNGVKERAAGLDAGGGIDGIGDQKDDSADYLQQVRFGQKAVAEVLRYGDGIIGHDGKTAQARSLEDPAERIADEQADADPRLAKAQGVNRCGQAHEHPGAHIRRAC